MTTESVPVVSPYPAKLQFQPWQVNGAMNAFFYNRDRVLLPRELIPDGKPHPATGYGRTAYYIADLDSEGVPFILTFTEQGPLPFVVGICYRPSNSHHFQIRCAECVRRWAESQGDL